METPPLSDSMNRPISKTDALVALGQVTGMSDAELLAQMPGLQGEGSIRLTANHTFDQSGSIPSTEEVRVQISEDEEYLLTLGDEPTIAPYGKIPVGYDGH